MTAPLIQYDLVDAIAWCTINQPERHNCLSRGVRTGLWDSVRRFNSDDRARVLVITGAGDRAFCAGGDLSEMAAEELQVPDPDYLPHFGRNIAVAKPTIAAVSGVALAGGFLLAQMCDLVVASDNATFGISEVKVGRGTPWATPLPWLIPPRIAMELLLTGEPIDADRALAAGLVNHVVPAAELRGKVQSLAEAIARNAPLSVRAAKETVYLAAELPRQAAFDRADQVWEPVYRSADAQEGPRAFREKRQPVWTGR